MSTGESGVIVQRAIDQIDDAPLPEDVVGCLAEFAAQLNISGVLVSIPSLSGDLAQPDHILGAQPTTLAEPFIGEVGLNTDAVVQRVKNDLRTLVWTGEDLWQACKAEQRALKDALDNHDMNGGLIVPAFGGSAMTGLIVMVGQDLALDESAVAHLKLVAIYAFDRACALQRASLREQYGLSDREFECMKWVAAGKTDWEIGQILSISPKTVNYHVENAKRKMSVPTRVQAVMAALLSGGFKP